MAAVNERVLPEDTSPDFAFKYIDISQVHSNGAITVPAEHTKFGDAPSRARRLAAPGSTVVSTVRTYLRAIGAVPTCSDPLVFSTGFAVLRPVDGDPRFFGYACRSDAFVNEVAARSVGVSYPAISPGDLMDIRLPTPDLSEQRRIADFLDDRVARIDQIITARRRQANLIAAHSRGQERELVEALFSGVPVVRLGYLARIRSGDFLPSTDYVAHGDFPVIGGNGVAGKFDRANTSAGCVAIGRVGALCGNVHLLQVDSWVTDNALVVHPTDDRINGDYVAVILDNAGLNRLASSTAQPLLTGPQVADQRIPLVSDDVRTALVDAVARARSRHIEASARCEASVRLLGEYKQSLITAAVTGDIDVTTAGSGIQG